MGKVLFVLLAIILMCSWGDNSYATGPSYADISIVPVTYNESGVILFKTRCVINLTGSHDFETTEYGWLVVSSEGIWEEIPHIILDPAQLRQNGQSEQDILDEYHKYREEFLNEFSWESPPKSVQEIVATYAFQQPPLARQQDNPSSAREMLHSLFSRYPETEVYLKQKSLKELSNYISQETVFNVTFSYAGVIVLKNIDREQQRIGAPFDIYNPMDLGDRHGCQDYGVEYQEIDGIILLNSNTTKE